MIVTGPDEVRRQAAQTVAIATVLARRKRMHEIETSEDFEPPTFAAFCKAMYRGYKDSRHIQFLTSILETAVNTPNSRTIVTMPPRHSKSVHVSELLPAYKLGIDPAARIIAASNTQRLANTFSRRVRNRIGSPGWMFPHVRVASDKGAVERWDIAGTDGGYIAVGRGGTPIGEGATLMIIDDVIRNTAEASSELILEQTYEWYQGTMYTRLNPGASIVLTMTRWTDGDLTGRLIDEMNRGGGEQWTHIHLPAIADDINDPIGRALGAALWPEAYPIERLAIIRAAVGERNWNAQYQGRPATQQGAIVKRDQLAEYTQLPAHIHTIVQSWDTAFKAGKDSDFSVCSTWGVGQNGAYLIDVWRDQIEFPELKKAAITLAERWRPNTILVEDKGSGQSLIQELQRSTTLPVIPVPVPPGEGKRKRLEDVTPYIEAGRVFIPHWEKWLADYLKELTAFPFGTHDDQVDSTSQALARIFKVDQQSSQGRARAKSHLPEDY